MWPWYLVIALLALLVVLLLLLVRRQARALREPAELSLRHPVVLVHGLCGFDQVGLPGFRSHYFRKVRRDLEGFGLEVHAPRIPALASVPDRAARLAAYIEGLDGPVIVVGHSMGGLDARYAVAKLGLAQRVACVVTIGTPHHGTPLADISQAAVARVVRKGWAAVGVGTEALDWLTPQKAEWFNQEVEDHPELRYFSVVGAGDNNREVMAVLRPAHRFLHKRVGANDGLVPAESQVWGEVLFESPADHLAQIGWHTGFDAVPLYRRLVVELYRRGY